MSEHRYVVIGAGAVGGVLAARLSQAGREVLLVARGEHGRVIAEHGLTVRHPDGVDTVRLPVVAGPHEVSLRSTDVLLLAVKTQDAEGALRDWSWLPLADVSGGVAADLPIVTFQNGLETESAALRRFASVHGATIAIAASYLTAGEVVSPSRAPAEGAIWVGRYPTGGDEVTEAVVRDLSEAGFHAVVSDDVRAEKSAKLLGNVGNGLDLLTGSDEDRDAARALLRAEATAALAAAGLPIGRLDAPLSVEPVEGHEPGRLSTWQSFARGASSEIDHLNGEIVLLARRHGLAAPVNERLQRLLGSEHTGPRDLTTLLAAVPGPAPVGV
ncbi:ketopantoate reductase family protein [Aeromicrobium alkaliterrae]|uniref:2-dehydropantoate 2-reductase N-terminal domain-containing protein n=1 Tax=Aeromicrobium alkaliterrae TaxID=302168 RepID=A0ABP4W753_9ACTN